MCLAIPVQITAIDGTTATFFQDDVLRHASTIAFDGLAVGDYVLVHSGIIVEHLDRAEADEILAAIALATDHDCG